MMIHLNLTPQQLERQADIAADIGQVSLASIAIPFFLSEHRPLLAMLGIVTALFLWTISVMFPKLKA